MPHIKKESPGKKGSGANHLRRLLKFQFVEGKNGALVPPELHRERANGCR
jgi:hypothetical protein